MVSSEEIQGSFRKVQDLICDAMVEADGERYREDVWEYGKGAGGGVTRVWEHATVFEKGGVNFSGIRGESLPPSAATEFQIPPGTPFLATGVSLVLHPWSPMIPTIHMNIRYFEAGDVWWFGGGIDLTPYYPVRGEVIEFHQALKAICDESGEDYGKHKAACDEYFYLKHRGEMRGVGGIFFDHLRSDRDRNFAFVRHLGEAFPNIYRPLIEAHRNEAYTDGQREFQLYRRGRYVEFNLVYDRGTLFGLQSGGRTESILMSLPAVAHWRYDWHAEAGSAEAELGEVYLQARDWAGEEGQGDSEKID